MAYFTKFLNAYVMTLTTLPLDLKTGYHHEIGILGTRYYSGVARILCLCHAGGKILTVNVYTLTRNGLERADDYHNRVGQGKHAE